MSIDNKIQEAVALGEANKRILELAQNWCMHLRVELRGGVGLVEIQTGLPIGMRAITCPYARGDGLAGMDLKAIALDFYDRNCVGCLDRKPGRFPNLSELVTERDEAAKRQEADRTRFSAEQALKLAERRRSREERKNGADEPRLGIYEAIDRLDDEQAKEESDVLEQIVKATPDRFTADVVESLFEVANAGGWGRTEGALRALRALGVDPVRLGASALGALARGDSVRTASSIVSDHLRPEHRDLVKPASWYIIRNAAPSDTIGLRHAPGDPAALIASFRLFPDIICGSLATLLTSRRKDDRIDACEALMSITDIHSSAGLELAPALISSLQWPDDVYDRGSAAHAVKRVLANTMRDLAEETDAVVSEAMKTADEPTRATLLGVYIQFLKPRWRGGIRKRTKSDPIAFRRILRVFLDRQPAESLVAAADFLNHGAKQYSDVLAEESETLLGAAAMLSEALANKYSPILDPRPSFERAMEAELNETRLRTALNGVIHALGYAIDYEPEAVGRRVTSTISGLGSSYPELRASLLESLGALGNKPASAQALPTLYSALTDSDQRVRAAAAELYGSLTKRSEPDDFPRLLHETFLVLLRDPFLIVHRTTVRALHADSIPPDLHRNALQLVGRVLISNLREHINARFISDCINEYLILTEKAGIESRYVLKRIVELMERIPAKDAAEVVYENWRIREAPNFADLVVRLLQVDTVPEYHLETLDEALETLPDSDLQRHATVLRDIGIQRIQRSPYEAIDFTRILARCGAWEEARLVVRAIVNQTPDTKAEKPRKLRFRVLECAVEIEAAAARKDYTAIATAASDWKAIVQEIQTDDEQNAEARRPFPGLPIPD